MLHPVRQYSCRSEFAVIAVWQNFITRKIDFRVTQVVGGDIAKSSGAFFFVSPRIPTSIVFAEKERMLLARIRALRATASGL